MGGLCRRSLALNPGARTLRFLPAVMLIPFPILNSLSGCLEFGVHYKAFRWWSLSELKNSSEFIVPPGLARYLEPVIANQIPSKIITISLGDNPDETHSEIGIS